MTATSVLTPTALTRSWTAVQRAAALLFVFAVFVALAFTVGRASVSVRHDSPVIAPPSLSVPAPSAAGEFRCRIGRPC
jgi:hypothetical protein